MIKGDIYKNQGKKQNLLSVVISCKGLLEILEENLLALSRQDLKRKLWSVFFIFQEGQGYSNCISLITEYFPDHEILFLPKDKPLYEMRNLAFNRIHSDYIYFIDEDVILDNPHHLSCLIEIHKKNSEVTVIGGSYLDHPDCSFWGQSYNWIARLWAKNHVKFVPAGNLSVKMTPPFQARFYSPAKFGFGGEEIHFIKSLANEGHDSLWKEELNVNHLAAHSLRDFVKRAWFHGASLVFEKGKYSYTLFIKEPAPFLIKISAFFYLLLVRFSFVFYRIFEKK